MQPGREGGRSSDSKNQCWMIDDNESHRLSYQIHTPYRFEADSGGGQGPTQAVAVIGYGVIIFVDVQTFKICYLR